MHLPGQRAEQVGDHSPHSQTTFLRGWCIQLIPAMMTGDVRRFVQRCLHLRLCRTAHKASLSHHAGGMVSCDSFAEPSRERGCRSLRAPSTPQMHHLSMLLMCLCDELHNTAGLLDLAFGILAKITGADDERDLRQAALAEDFAVAEREEVEDGCGVGLGALCEVLLALLERDEGPELCRTAMSALLDQRKETDACIPCRG